MMLWPRAFRFWTVPGSGNSSPAKTRTTFPRSLRTGIPSEKEPFRAIQPTYTPRDSFTQVPVA